MCIDHPSLETERLKPVILRLFVKWNFCVLQIPHALAKTEKFTFEFTFEKHG